MAITGGGTTVSTYVLVADGGTARLFRAKREDKPLALEEVVVLVRPSAHVKRQALVSDRTGRVFARAGRATTGSRAGARGGADSDYDPQDIEVDRFARRIVRRLDDERRSGELERLHIVAEPRFLGVLRDKLSKPTRGLVQDEVALDMIHAKTAEIARKVGGKAH